MQNFCFPSYFLTFNYIFIDGVLFLRVHNYLVMIKRINRNLLLLEQNQSKNAKEY